MAVSRRGYASSDFVGVSVVVNVADINRINKRLDKWIGKPLALRTQRAMAAGMKLLVEPIRAATPVGKTGNLKASVGLRALRKRSGEIAAYAVGPIPKKGGRHRHLVILGHDMVGHKPAKVRSGFTTKANPFVSRIADPLEPTVTGFIDQQVRRLA